MSNLESASEKPLPNMRSDLWGKNATLAIIIGVMGFILLVQWIYNIVHRIPFPFPIEYIEDAIFFQALRIYNGLPIYIDPNDGYAALIYTPGYFYLLAGLFKVFGPSIIMGRIISLLCTLGIGAMIVRLSITRLKFPLSIVPICVYLSLPYAYFAGYQDLGRVDPLMTFMIFAGLYLCGVGKPGRARIFIGVILLTLAYYIKQPALGYLYFVYIYLFVRYKTTGFLAILLSFVLLLGIFFGANALTGGWFSFYTWELPMTHAYHWSALDEIFVGGGVHATYILGILSIAIGIGIYIVFRLFTLRREPINIFEATLPGALIATVGPFLKEGGYHQDLIPLHTHICFLLPFALSIPLFGADEKPRNIPKTSAHVVTSAILFFLMIHCVFSITPWENFRPKPDNIHLGRDFVSEIKKIDGDVLMPALSYYGWLAGHEQDYVGASLIDLLQLNIQPAPLLEDVNAGRFAAICVPIYFDIEGYMNIRFDELGYAGPEWLIETPMQNYELCHTLEPPPNKVYLRVE